jgi:phage tail sheath gpL-like
MASTVVVIKHTDKLPPMKTGAPKVNLRTLLNFLTAIVAGIKQAKSVDIHPNASADPVAASGTLTISSGSGTVGGSINGVSITVTWGTSDTATATALAAAINASTNALVQNLVTASAAAGVVTITAVQKGKQGNTMTLAASGTGVTASGARLTGGTGGDVVATSCTL